jgi:hypothetical protein
VINLSYATGFGIVSGVLLFIVIAGIAKVGDWLKKNKQLSGITEIVYACGSLLLYTIIGGIIEYLTLYILFPNEMFMVGLSGVLPSYIFISLHIIDILLYIPIIWIFCEIFEDDMKSALYVFGWMYIIQVICYGDVFYLLILIFVKVLIALVIIKILSAFENN